jgi:hypothetical protein
MFDYSSRMQKRIHKTQIRFAEIQKALRNMRRFSEQEQRRSKVVLF